MLLSSFIYCQDVDKQLAEKVAENFFDISISDSLKVKKSSLLKSKNLTRIKVKETLIHNFKNHPSYYIHNMEGGGYVITTANKSTGPVICYSENGYINLTEIPSCLTDLLATHDTIIDLYSTKKYKKQNKIDKWNSLEQNLNTKLKVDVIYVAPLLNSKWGQSYTNDYFDVSAYNYKVPSINTNCNGGKCPVGCVATAMGQIINYWGYSYGSNADFDWWDMPATGLYYQSTNYISEREAVSHLLERCANKSGMIYCKGDKCASSSWVADNILSEYDAKGAFEYFDYEGISSHYYSRPEPDLLHPLENLNIYDQWVNRLKDELDAGRPILYGVKGHAVVCDGYKNSHTFHFNLGWIGLSDNWYDIEDFKTADDDFSQRIFHCCLTGIRPDLDKDLTFGNENYGNGCIKRYQFSNDIIAGGNNNTITANLGSKLSLVAGNSITLKPGFYAKPGSTFEAVIYLSDACKNHFKSNIETSDTLKNTIFPKNNCTLYTVYPSPFSNNINIKSSNDSKSPIYVNIFNENGKNIYTGTFSSSSNIEINLKENPSGIYFISIKQDSIESYQQIIKN